MALVETQLSREAMPLMAIRQQAGVAAVVAMGQLVAATPKTVAAEVAHLA